jgi:hypothetical protein
VGNRTESFSVGMTISFALRGVRCYAPLSAGKGKIQSKTGHQGPEGSRYIAVLLL